MAKQKLHHISPFNLRLQPDLKAKLAIEARKATRSLNAEITDRLEKSVLASDGLNAYTDGQLIDELVRRWGRDAVYIQLGNQP